MPKGQSDGSVVVDILLDGEKAKKYWENFNSYMNMSTKQLEGRLSKSVSRMNELESKYASINQKIKELRGQRLDLSYGAEDFENAQKAIAETENEIDKLKLKLTDLKNYEGLGHEISHEQYEEQQRKIQLVEEEINKLVEQRQYLQNNLQEVQAQKIAYDEITRKIQELQLLRKEAYADLKNETNEFNQMNEKYVQLNRNNREAEKTTKNIEHHTKAIKHNTANIGASVKSGVSKLANGLKKVVRLSLALIGIRGIYTGIASAMRTWLNSEDELAKKTKANMENLKMNFAQMLQPALTWIINAFNNILALVGAVIKQFTKMNIFAKKTAQSTGTTSKNMQNTLASFDKIDVLQKNDGSGDGESAVEPIDMEGLMNKYDELAGKIKAILETLFDPFKKAWEEKGQGIINSMQTSFESIKGLAEAIGTSLYDVWTNGTLQTTAETILGILENLIKVIGNVAEAWKNAWTEDDKGTKIVQNLADAFNGLLGIIEALTGMWEKFTASEGYQKFINAFAKGVEVLSQGIKLIAETWQKMFEENSSKWAENFDKIFGNFGEIFQTIFDLIQQIMSDEKFQATYKRFVEAIGNIVTILTDWWVVLSDILNLIVNPKWENVQKLFNDIATFLKDIVKSVVQALNLEEFFKTLATKVETAKKTIVEKFEKLKTEVPKKMQQMKEEVAKKVEEIKNNMTTKFEEAKKNVVDKFETLKTNITTKVENIRATLVEKFEEAKNRVIEKAENIRSGVAEKFETLKGNITEKIENIKTIVQNKFEEIRSGAVEKFETMKGNVVGKFEEMRNNIAEKIDLVKGIIAGKWEEIQKVTGEKVNQVWNAITLPFKFLGETFEIILNKAKEALKTPLNNIIGVVETMVNKVIEMLNTMIDKVNSVYNNSFFQTFFGSALGSYFANKWGWNKDGMGHIDEIHIPRLAKGAIVTQATPAIIGEAGKEAVIPLENNTDWLDALADRIAESQSFNIRFTGSLSQLARVLKPEIDRENKRVGKSYIIGGASY